MKQKEQSIRDNWCLLLDLEEPAPQQNFFELGGDSLVALELFTRVAEETGWELPIDVLLTTGSYEALLHAANS
jgi:acyl carrier protein